MHIIRAGTAFAKVSVFLAFWHAKVHIVLISIIAKVG